MGSAEQEHHRHPGHPRTKNGLPPEIVEILKAITGNDPLDINGKGRDIVSEPIHGKVIAATNNLLQFADDSGAFFDRLVPLKFTRSFLPPDHPDYIEGQEQDPGLEAPALTRNCPAFSIGLSPACSVSSGNVDSPCQRQAWHLKTNLLKTVHPSSVSFPTA